jgi:hypothetical protein
MKNKPVFYIGILLAVIFVVAVSWHLSAVNASPPAAETPKQPFYFGIQEPTVYSKSVVDSPRSHYQFEPVLQFDQVRHDFIIKNTSDKPLEVKKAYGCCGSLVEAFSTQIPPKGEGVVKVLLFTDRRGGQTINGTIHLMTTDPENPEWTIGISCEVKKFTDISEYTIMLNGSWRKLVEGTSAILPIPEYPFRIVSLKAKRGLYITYGYREITQAGRKGYLVWAKNVRKGPGVIRDTIYVETDNPARKQFLIRVQGKLTD